MKNIYKNSSLNLARAKKILMKNNIIGLPTETVYGLAGNAYSNNAVKKIYKLKKRPRINPLIIHYYNLRLLKKDAFLSERFLKLYKKFSPGPLTYILKKRKNSKISSFANANLKTIAVRFPQNRIIRKLLSKLNFPLAIPSANLSSAVSPVCSNDVLDECDKLGVPVFVDCAYLVMARDIKFDFDRECIEGISFSLSKGFYGAEHLRIGMRLTKKLNAHFGIHSNGSQLKKLQNEQNFCTELVSLMESKYDYFSCSLDGGSPKSHMKTKNIKYDAWTEIIEGIKILVSERDRQKSKGSIRVAYLLNKWNSSEDELKKVVILNNLNFSTSYNLAADSLRLSPVRMTGGTQLFKNKMIVNPTKDLSIRLRPPLSVNSIEIDNAIKVF